MPLESQPQSRLFHWQEEHPGQAPRGAKKPIPIGVVYEFITATHGMTLPKGKNTHVKNGKPVRFGHL